MRKNGIILSYNKENKQGERNDSYERETDQVTK